MLTVKLLNNKELVTTTDFKLYQRQSLIDNMQILVPATYGEFDLTKFSARIEYIDPANVSHMEMLAADEELYQDTFIRYTFPIDSNFTRMAGRTAMQLSLTYIDQAENKSYVLKSGELEIEVQSLNDYFAFQDNSSMSFIDNKIIELQNETNKLAALAEIYASKIPDDLALSDDALLQLSVNGSVMGMGVQIAKPVDENDGKNDGIIDLNIPIPEGDDNDDDPVTVIDL